MKRLAMVGAALSMGLMSGACAPTVDRRGYQPDEQQTFAIEPGVDTRTTVLSRLGSPSTLSTYDSNVWYYVSEKKERYAFYTPKTVDREVVAVRFGASGAVEKVENYGLADGRVIAYNDRKTPTRGRELSILEQLLGNVGRTPLGVSPEDEGPGQSKRR